MDFVFPKNSDMTVPTLKSPFNSQESHDVYLNRKIRLNWIICNSLHNKHLLISREGITEVSEEDVSKTILKSRVCSQEGSLYGGKREAPEKEVRRRNCRLRFMNLENLDQYLIKIRATYERTSLES